MADDVKIVSLDNIKVVKNYIDKVRGELSSRIDSVTEDYLEGKLNDAQQAIMDAYREDMKEVNERIAYVEAFGEEYEGQLMKLKLQLSEIEGDAAHKQEALDALSTQLEILAGKHDDLYDGIISGAVFNEGELNAIIKSAMIEEVQITEDAILTPEMYASKVVALIANFGSVKAANIDAGTIKGSSIESSTTDYNTGQPVWMLDNDGSGWVANKNIQWTRDGDVIFGPDVTLSWESITGGDSAVQKALDGYDDVVGQKIADYVQLRTDGAATIDELNKLRKDANEAIAAVQTSLTETYDEKVELLQTAIDTTQESLRAEYNAENINLQLSIEGAKEELNKAIEAGDEALVNQWKDVIAELQLQYNKLEAGYAETSLAVASLKKSMSQVENSLDPDQMADLLAASLITETEVGDDFVSTPNVLAKKITALIGTFGTVTANDLTANTIEGFTIQAPTVERDPEGYILYEYETITDPDTGLTIQNPIGILRKKPTWQLNYDGSGFVGRGNTDSSYESDGITWDTKGNLTLGSNVTISWNNVDGGNEAVDDAVDSAKDELNDNIANTAGELRKTLKDLEKTVNDLEYGATDIGDLNNKFDAWAADNTLSPIELSNLTEDYNAVVKEYDYLKTKIYELNGILDTWANGVSNNTILSEYTNTEITNLKIDITELNTSKDKVKDMYNYYINGEKDSYGCIAIDDGHPLSVISDYYKVQNEYILKYQDAATAYYTNNRFGSKTTWIGDTGIYSGKIMGDNIIGKRIAGLTVESGSKTTLPSSLKWYNYNSTKDAFEEKTGGTGPTWQIYNDGSGHLANGNIYWDNNGTMNCNVNGSFSSSATGTIAAGAMTWDENSVYLNKNLVMGASATISWSNISGTPDIATKEYVDENAGGMTEEQFRTEIGEDWIKTADVTCQNLTVQKLNTTGTGNYNNIVASGNTINAYNTSSKPALTITGNAFNRIRPYKKIAIDGQTSKYSDSSNTNSTYYSIFTWQALSTYTDAKIIVPDINVRVEAAVVSNTGITGNVSGTWWYELYSGSTLVESYGYNSVTSTATGSSGVITGAYQTLKGFTYNVTPGKSYTVKLYVGYGGTTTTSSTWTVNTVYTYFESDLIITGTYGVDRTDIGENGFRVCHDSAHIIEFAEYNNNGSYMIYSNAYGIKISDSALFLKLANQWYSAGTATISGNTVLKLTTVTEDSVLGNDSDVGDSESESGYGSYGNTAAIWEE